PAAAPEGGNLGRATDDKSHHHRPLCRTIAAFRCAVQRQSRRIENFAGETGGSAYCRRDHHGEKPYSQSIGRTFHRLCPAGRQAAGEGKIGPASLRFALPLMALSDEIPPGWPTVAFGGEADIHWGRASRASVANDPKRTSAANFAVTHNAAFLIRTKASFVTPST